MAVPQNILDDLAAIQQDVGAIQDKQAAIPGLQADVSSKQAALTEANTVLLTAQQAVKNDTDGIAVAIAKLTADVAALNASS